jgi:ribulose kinase
MQLSAILSLALAASVSAVPIAQDLPTILSSIGAISTALTTFDTAVKGLTETTNVATATVELNSKSAAILAALKDGTTKVSGTTPVTLTEAIQLASKSSELSKGANGVVDTLIAKKAIFEKAGQSATVLKQLQDQLAATNDFAKALVSKLPAAVASVGNAQAKQASDALVVSFPSSLFAIDFNIDSVLARYYCFRW